MRHLVIDPSQPAESRRFQLAHQLAALALAKEIAAVVEASPLRTAAARQLLHVGLANYAAGAVLMPYRSEEHTSELQSLMRISYAVFCLKKKKQKEKIHPHRY